MSYWRCLIPYELFFRKLSSHIETVMPPTWSNHKDGQTTCFEYWDFFRLPWKNNVTTWYILERSSCKHKHVHLQLSYISGRRKVSWYFPISRTAPHMYGRSAPFLKVSKHSKLIHQHCHFIWNVKTVDISHSHTLSTRISIDFYSLLLAFALIPFFSVHSLII